MIINKDDAKLQVIKNRGNILEGDYIKIASEIVSNVRNNGDKAVIEYCKKFDNFNADNGFQVADEEIKNAFNSVSDDLKIAMEKAKDNILSFHEKQVEQTWLYEKEGIMLGQKVMPLEKVGVYVPGGKASYFSSVMMNVLPAVAAGVKDITMCSPATNGYINPALLVAASICGVSRIFKVGGAQAIGALAYGTESIPKVDKITGPGNIYVAMAKKIVFGTVDIDMIAGPSEVLVIADKSANPKYVASDMLAQCEHDELASAVCITDNKELAIEIEKELKIQLELLPKKDIAKVSLDKFSAIILVDNISEAYDLSNDIAPEHLELYVESPMEKLPLIKNAGAIFLGGNTPEAVGDYFAGPNHVLPTGSSARFFSPLGAYDFLKKSSIIYYTKEALQKDSKHIMDMAKSENLEAHLNSIKVRIDN